MPGSPGSRSRPSILVALACLYTAQGVPFGFATEYLPVVLREQGLSYKEIAAVGWLQLPWYLKIFWSKAADHPRLRTHTRFVILAMQLALTATVAAFALRPLREARTYWFVLTAVAAAIAATQDVFVDAFAVRVLRPEERGFGNTAQIAGYRTGMLLGGAALLTFVATLGEGTMLLVCAALVAAASVGAFVSSEGNAPPPSEKPRAPTPILPFLARLFHRDTVVVLLVAATFKLGLHMATSIMKPMVVDHHWTQRQIGIAVVTFGTGGGLFGAAVGGWFHQVIREKKALVLAALFQCSVCLPLIVVDRLGAPIYLTTAAFALEHFVSGLGTTVLFAALMSATRKSDAGLHYTVLTSANAIAIGVGAMIGGAIADAAGKTTTFIAAAIVCMLPLALLTRWDEAAAASHA